MAVDRIAAGTVQPENPAVDAAVVSPNDGDDLPFLARGLYVGGGGDVRLNTQFFTTITFFNVQAGSILPVRAHRVFLTGTTATNIVALT